MGSMTKAGRRPNGCAILPSLRRPTKASRCFSPWSASIRRCWPPMRTTCCNWPAARHAAIPRRFSGGCSGALIQPPAWRRGRARSSPLPPSSAPNSPPKRSRHGPTVPPAKKRWTASPPRGLGMIPWPRWTGCTGSRRFRGGLLRTSSPPHRRNTCPRSPAGCKTTAVPRRSAPGCGSSPIAGRRLILKRPLTGLAPCRTRRNAPRLWPECSAP